MSIDAHELQGILDAFARERGRSTIFRFAKDVEDGGGLLTVRQEHEPPPTPVRRETPPRAHGFHALDGFAAYLAQYASPRVVVFADVHHHRFAAVLDERAEEGVEIVTFGLTHHPRWRPWADRARHGPLPLESFVDFVRAQRRAILEPDGRWLVAALSQVEAATEVTLYRGEGRRSTNGLIVKSEVKGGNDQKSNVDLPDTIKVGVPMFVGEGTREADLDVIFRVTPDGRAVTVEVSSADVDHAEIEAFEDMVARLDEDLAAVHPEAVVAWGAPDHGRWSYLPAEGGAARLKT